MESKVRHVDVVNFYAFITQNYTQFALKIVILLFKFVQALQEFSYYVKMHFIWVLKVTLAQFQSLHVVSFTPILITVNCRLSSSLWPSCSLAPTYHTKHNLPEPAKSATRARPSPPSASGLKSIP